ncbi:MAG: HAMP domain-containing protein, partial [Treponema sp.]|nr:HAMP domain-containing protein [Treponema sp.]
MKLKYRLSAIVISILVVIVAAISIILLNHAAKMQMESAHTSQERLAAEQARILQIHYETYLHTVYILADTLSDFDKADVGRQRNRFDQFMESILQSEERVVGIFTVFKPNTIDPGIDAAFAELPGSTKTGQWANWYTRQSGKVEHRTFDNVEGIMHTITGENARKEMIYDPVPQTVGGRDTYTVMITVPVIHRKTNEIVGRAGINIDMALTQPIVDNIINDPTLRDISAMTVYSNNGTVIASYAAEHIGKPLTEAQNTLYDENTNRARDAVLKGEKERFSKYSDNLRKNLEIILYPFTIGETGANWSLMLATEKNIILEDVNALTFFTLIIGIAAAFIAAVIVFIISGNIARPIVRVSLTLKDISEGEGDLTKTVNVNSKDEIGDLARYFNATLEKI